VRKGKTFEEIGARNGISGTRARQIYLRAMAKMAKRFRADIDSAYRYKGEIYVVLKRHVEELAAD
jgi:DNA-directed RNA polymerase sigma subunit (sigma70/sigma32)